MPRMAEARETADPEAACEWTRRLSVIEGCVWSVMSGFGEMFVSPFAIFLGAGHRAIGLLGSMPSIVGAVAQAVGAAATDRLGRRRALIVPLVAAQGLMFLPLFWAPFLWRGAAVPAVLICAALATFCGSAAAPAWLSLMGDVVPAATRGDYFARRNRLVQLFVFVAHLAAGGLLFVLQQAGRVWAGFALLFTVACLARLLSARMLAAHHDPPYRPPREAYFSFWDFLRRLPRSNFARFALYIAMMMGACNVAAPFFNVYTLRDLHWSYAQFTVSQAVFLLSQFVLLRAWGRLGDRYGHRAVVVATGFVIPIIPLLWVFSSDYFYLLGVQVVAGAGWSGFSIATLNFTFDAVTPHKRARIASFTTILNGLFNLLGGTVVGPFLADHLPSAIRLGPLHLEWPSPLPAVFLASALLRLLASLLMVPRFKEVRPVEPVHPAALILRLAGGEALAGLVAGATTRVRRPRSAPLPQPRQQSRPGGAPPFAAD